LRVRARGALGAVVTTTALALLDGCTGVQRLPGEHALAGPGAHDDAIDIDSFATRIDKDKVPLATADHPSRGPAGAPVTIHLFSDFECPYCRSVGPVLREIEAEFGGNIRTVWHNFPLPGHPHAELAAVAGVLVYKRRGGAAFWRFHDATFDAAEGGLDPGLIEALASREGVDPATVRAALATGADGRVAADIAAADKTGVEGTPAFVVNDRMVTGVLPYPEFRALVAHALAEARHK
jgi:protein-disulfide isomerase